MIRTAMKDGLSSIQNLSGDDLLAALGLEKRRAGISSTVVPSIAIFTAGALVGAAAAVLLTPKSGAELRRDLSDGAKRLSNSAQEYTGLTRGSQGNVSSAV